MIKTKLHFGDELKDCKITFPPTVPVTINFDNTKIIGTAKLYEQDGNIMADVNIDENNPDFMFLLHQRGVNSSAIKIGNDVNLKTLSI